MVIFFDPIMGALTQTLLKQNWLTMMEYKNGPDVSILTKLNNKLYQLNSIVPRDGKDGNK
ncbi:hypothetical protein B6D14_09720 [Gilliamella apis]|nr:hypothetical protein B6D14_09720 [Gilliamella apis]